MNNLAYGCDENKNKNVEKTEDKTNPENAWFV